jgi:hypothetical protein
MEVFMEVSAKLVQLAGHLAWPVTVILVAYTLRVQVRSLISAITKRIEDKTSDISIGKEGLAIKCRTDAALGSIESLRLDVDEVKNKLAQLQTVTGDTGFVPAETTSREADLVDNGLLKLADDYLKITATEWGERVRMKDEAAISMGDYINSRRISRDLLAKQEHEGLILGLASAIHSAPEKGDLDRLLRVRGNVSKLHVKYRIVMAIGRIFERNLVSIEDITRVLSVLDQFAQGADDSLARRITQTRSIINIKTQE